MFSPIVTMWYLLLLFVCFPAVITMFDCNGQPDGIYEPGCKTFVRCTGGKAETIECGKGFVYNSQIGDCDLIANVDPPCSRYEDCSDKADGHYPDYDQFCASFYTCQNGRFLGHNFCPVGLVFNELIDTCDWMQNVYMPCGLLHRPPTTPTS